MIGLQMSTDKFLKTMETWLQDFGLADTTLYKELRKSYLRWPDWPREDHKGTLIDYTAGWLWCEVYDRVSKSNRPKQAERMADDVVKAYKLELQES